MFSELISPIDINSRDPILIEELSNIVQISVSITHLLCVDSNGHVIEYSQRRPICIILNNIIQVSVGSHHTLALSFDGMVYGGGSSYHGQLGSPKEYTKVEDYILIPGLSNIVQIACGHMHSLVLDNNGNVYSFGSNGRGELGLGDKHTRFSPHIIPTLTDIVQISASEHSLFLNKYGQVYSCGSNYHGQLGYKTISGDFQLCPKLVPNLSNNIIQVSAGSNHSLALTSNGEVYSFGSNPHNRFSPWDIAENRFEPVLIPNFSIY